MELLRRYLKENLPWLLAVPATVGVFALVLALYRLPVRAIAYPAALCFLLFGLAVTAHFFTQRRRHRRRRELRRNAALLTEPLEVPVGIEAQDFRDIAEALRQTQMERQAADARQYREMLDYFTLWAHQIKTPIAAMRLQLQGEDSAAARQLMAELSRTEQYAEMVLTYLRLGSDTTDYVFRRCDLDDILRRALRRFSGEFILRKLTLSYEPLHRTVLTDEKWLTFVVEQLLSNALKYTRRGGIRIYMEPSMTLCIADSGIGIAPEDLPRIFEQGYTGLNGRCDQRASGIGLYLCRRVCQDLGITLRAASAPGEGSVFSLGLRQQELRGEQI